MERPHQPVEQAESRITDIDKAYYMAEKAKPYANRAAFGRTMLRTANKAEEMRVDRKVALYEALYRSDIVGTLEKAINAGMIGSAEVASPSLSKGSDKVRRAYRSKLEAWAEKQDSRAVFAMDQAAEQYDANDSHPDRVTDIGN